MLLPASVQMIADVIGSERALYLIGQLPRCYSGKPGKKSHRPMLYVPKPERLSDDHRLVQILGRQWADKLSRHFGGEMLSPANCAEHYRRFRDQNIIRMVIEEGIPKAEVAEFMQVSERHVRNLVRGLENPQGESRTKRQHNQVTPGNLKQRNVYPASAEALI